MFRPRLRLKDSPDIEIPVGPGRITITFSERDSKFMKPFLLENMNREMRIPGLVLKFDNEGAEHGSSK